MLKQSLGRNQRPKGFKVKHVFQMCVLLIVSVWLLYQLKRSYENNNKNAYEDGSVELTEKVQSVVDGVLKLGRKGIDPRVVEETVSDNAKHVEDEEDESDEGGGSIGGGIAEEEGYEGGGGDLVDEDDREREEGGAEKETQIEGGSSLEEDQDYKEPEKNREDEEYKGDMPP